MIRDSRHWHSTEVVVAVVGKSNQGNWWLVALFCSETISPLN